MSMNASNKKRRYVIPCHCPLCKGKERDSRTVVKHAGLIPVTITPSADPATSSSVNLQTNEDNTYFDSDRDRTSAFDEDHTADHEDHYDEDHTSDPTDDEEVRPRGVRVPPSTDDDDESTTPTEVLEKRQKATGLSSEVIKYIMKELQVKLKYGASRAEFEEHLKNVKGLVDGNIPIEWKEVMKLLKILGYNEPQWFRVCIKQDHSYLLSSSDELCAFCQATWNDCIDYFVLGLGIDDWFTTDEKCHHLMSHWEDRESWLGTDADTDTSLSELWHGERFKSLSWFWDPQQTTLLPGSYRREI